MKAQTFKIVGSPKQLEAIFEVLLTFGYTQHTSPLPKNSLVVNFLHFSSKEEYKKLAYVSDGRGDVTFTLPEDYNKALDFAKAQLADELWREKFKVEEFIVAGVDIVKAEAYKITEVTEDGYNTLSKKRGYQPLGKYVRKATPEEIEEYNRKEYKVGQIIKSTITKEVTKIDKIDGNGWYSGKNKKGHVYDTYFPNAIAATPQEIEEFNRIDWKDGDIASTIGGDIFKISAVKADWIEGYDKRGSFKTAGNGFSLKPTPEQIEEFNKPVYKAGDWAVSTETVNNYLPKNYVFQIDKIETDWIYCIGVDELEHHFARESRVGKHIRLATPEEIKKATEPKDGDIVITNGKSLYKGKICKLTFEEDGRYKLYDKTGEYWLHGTVASVDFNDYMRKATKEEIAEFNKPIFKSGAIVYSLLINKVGTLAYALGKYCILDKNGDTIATDGLQYINDGIRYATEKEKEEFNKKPEYVEMIVGSRNAKIKVYKNRIEIIRVETVHNSQIIELEHVKGTLTRFRGINLFRFGTYQTAIDYNQRFFRIGCTSENNLVSLNEIKAVLDAAEKL